MKTKPKQIKIECLDCKRLKKDYNYSDKELKREHDYCENEWYHCGNECCG